MFLFPLPSRLQVVSVFLAGIPFSSALPLLSSSSHVAARQSTTSAGTIEWTPCDESFPPSLQCANFTVPLDWKNPSEDGETVLLSMVRLPASDTARRIGNLFLNPGGPGGSATATVAGFATDDRFTATETRARFDLIGVDPRGIGRSTPLDCDRAIWNERVALFPTSEADFAALLDHNRRAGDSCRARSGRLLDFMDTVSVARDHEAVRQALPGNETINWLGLSYGTQLASQYAELFPHNYRAIVLDGNLQHSQGESSNLLIESTAYETELHRFFAWCDRDATCALHNGGDPTLTSNTSTTAATATATATTTTTATTAAEAWDALLARAAQAPLPAPACDDTTCRSTVTAEEIRFAVDGIVVGSPMSWPALAGALAAALTGNDASELSGANPLFVGADRDAASASGSFGFLAVVCQDWTHATRSYGELRDKMAAARVYAPRTLGATQTWQIQLQCLGWPANVTNPPHQLQMAEDAGRVLVVNSFYDPSTSYVWGTGMRDEIAQRVMLSRDGDGHTSYGRFGETASAIDQYLLTGQVPAEGTVLAT